MDKIKTQSESFLKAVAKKLPTDPRLRVAVVLATFVAVGGAAVAGEQVVKQIPNLPIPGVEKPKETPAAYPGPEGSPTPYPQPGVLSKEIKIYISGGAFAQNLPFVTNPIQLENGQPAKDVPVDFVLTRPDGSTVSFTLDTNSGGRVIGIVSGSELTENGEYTLTGTMTEGVELEGKTVFAIAETKTSAGETQRAVNLVEGPAGQPGQPGEAGAAGAAGATGATGAQGEAGEAGTATCPNGPCASLQAAYPGVQETGNLYLSGTVGAADLVGSGAAVTDVNAAQLAGQSQSFYRDASNLNAGTLDNSRLTTAVSLLGQTIDNAELVGGITDDKLSTISAAGKVADTALSGNVTVAGNVFNGVGQLVQLNGSGALPAVSGSNLTALNASNIASGTIANARLDSAVSLLGQTIGSIEIEDGSIGNAKLENGSVDAVKLADNAVTTGKIADGTIGNDDIAGGAGITDTKLATISTAGKVADTALSGNVTVAGNTFNGLNQLVRLDGSGALPAVSGAALTNVTADTLDGQDGTYYLDLANATGTLSDARLSGNVTVAGNTFNGNSQLVQTTAGGALPAISGANLTSVNAATLGGQAGSYYTNASNLASGTVADARLSGNVTLLGNVFNGANQLVQLSAGGALPAVSGAALTNVNAAQLNGQAASFYTNASNLSSGTLSDDRLSGNVTKAGNTFNGPGQLAQLDGSGKIATATLPAIAISETFVVANEAAQLALSAEEGDVAVRTDQSKSYIQNGGTAGTMADWTELATPEDAVLSVAGKTGVVTLAGEDIASGTINDARLSGNVTLGGNTFNGASQLVQLTAGGALPAISGANLTALNASNISSGTINDARLSGNVTVAGNSFNGNSQLVQTTAGGALPAVSGANLTALNASNLGSGTVPDARLSGNVTVAGNTFNGASQLVQLTAGGALPAVSGANLTSVNAATLGGQAGSYYLDLANATGTLADARLSGNVTLAGNAFNGASQLVQLTAGGALPAISGANLTALNASNISSGTIADGRLSGNVALLNGSQVFTGSPIFRSDTANGFRIQQADETDLLNVNTDTGTVTVSGLAGSGANLTALNASNISSGTLDNARLNTNVSLLGQTIGNSELENSSVSYGGVSLALGGSDATPAFDLADATNLPIGSTTGTLAVNRGGTGATDASGARTNLGLVIGTDVQAYDAELAALAGLTSAADTFPYFTGSGTAGTTGLTGFARTILDDADAATVRATIGAGTGSGTVTSVTCPSGSGNLTGGGNTISTSGTCNAISIGNANLNAVAGVTSAADTLAYFTGSGTAGTTGLTGFGRSLIDDANASDARSTLGLVIGTNVQAYDADLDVWATKTAPSGTVVGNSDSQTLTNKTISGSDNTITNLNASNLTTGTVADARLSGNVTLQGNSFNGPNQLSRLDGDGKIVVSTLPAIAISETFVVADETEQLALDAQEGDVAIRTDQSKSYIQNGGTAGTMADWTELATPEDAVLSVAGKTGVVTLAGEDIASGTINDARLSGNVTVQGNTFNGASQLVQLNGSSQLPAVSGALLTNVNAATLNGQAGSFYQNADNLNAGTVPNARLDAELSSIAGLTSAANKLPYYTGSGTAVLADFSAYGRNLVDDADAAAAISTLGLDADIATLSLPASTTISAFGASLIDDADAATARATIGAGTGNGTVTSVTCPSGTGNLTGGGDVITGSGTCSALNTVNNPTFSGLITGSANDQALSLTGAPTNSATQSLFRLGGAIAGGNTATDGGTYIGLNAPNTGPGSAADLVNLQKNGTSQFKVSSGGNVDFTGTATGNGSGLTSLNASNISSGTLDNARLNANVSLLGQTIGNSELENSTVSYGGVSLALGGSDATPAFDLADATNLPIGSTTGTLAVNRGGTGETSYTKGDLLAATGASSLGKLGVGADGQILKANSATATGLEWGPAGGTGTVTSITEGTGINLTPDTITTTGSVAVNYGSSAGTAVQGNTVVNCPSGSGNLTGGGTAITLGAGGTCGAISIGDAELNALAGLTSAADKGIYFTGSGTAGTYDLTSFARTILDDADAATVRSTIGAGTGNGTITEVTAGTGLTGGGSSGSVNLDIGAGSNIAVNANDVAVISNPTFSGLITGSANDQALSLTGAPTNSATQSLFRLGGAIASGNTAADGGTYIGLNAPNTGPGSAADLVNLQKNGTSQFKVSSGGNVDFTGTATGNGSGLTSLNASNISSGTLDNARLNANVSLLGQTIGNSELENSSVSYGGVSLALGGSDATPAFDLTDATNLNASQLASGTVPNARLDGELSAIAGLTSAANQLPYYTGSGTAALTGLTATGRDIIDSADAAEARAAIGAGTGNGTVTSITCPSGSGNLTGGGNTISTSGTCNALDVGSNVPLKNASNTFSEDQIISSGGKDALQLTNTGANTGLTIGGDTNLYREGANSLATDDAFSVNGGNLWVNNGGVFANGDMIRSTRSGTGFNAFQAMVQGESNARYAVLSEGEIQWGPGNASADTNLYRASADNLKTDDTFDAATYKVGGTSGSTASCAAGEARTGASYTSGLLTTGGSCTAIGGTTTLQSAYNAGNTITTTDARDIDITLADTATDANFDVNVATSGSGQFRVQDNGTTNLSIAKSGDVSSNGSITLTRSGSTDTFRIFQTGDTQPRYKVNSAGFTEWGQGGATSPDTNLYRSAANVLKTDDAFSTGSISGVTSFSSAGTWLAPNGQLTSVVGTAGTPALRLAVTGEGNARFRIANNGSIDWGDGTASPDTNLYRSAANQLATDDVLLVNYTGAGGGGPSTNPGIIIRNNGATPDGEATLQLDPSGAGASYTVSADDTTGGFRIHEGTTQRLQFDTSGNLNIGTSDTTGNYLRLDIKTDTGDPTGTEGAMYYNSASKQFRCYRGGPNAWQDCMGVPKPNDRRWTYVTANSGSATMSQVGESYTGSFASATGNANTNSLGSYTRWSTTNVAGNTGALTGTTGNYYSGNRILYQSGWMAAFNFLSSQTARAWHGLSNQTAATMTASINPTGRYAMFNMQNGTDAHGAGTGNSSNAWCATNDGSGNSTQADSGVSVLSGAARYEIEYLNGGATTVFRINGNEVCTSGWLNPTTGGAATKEEPGTAAMQSLYTLNHLVVGGSAIAPWIDIYYMYVEQGQ